MVTLRKTQTQSETITEMHELILNCLFSMVLCLLACSHFIGICIGIVPVQN